MGRRAGGKKGSTERRTLPNLLGGSAAAETTMREKRVGEKEGLGFRDRGRETKFNQGTRVEQFFFDHINENLALDKLRIRFDKVLHTPKQPMHTPESRLCHVQFKILQCFSSNGEPLW
jgi:hypothetical protein